MNRVTKAINAVDEWLSPLSKLVEDEQFRGEFLKELGAKQKEDPASKQKAKEKLNFVLNALNKLRLKLGLDKSDVPNVGNIIALGLLLAELYKVWEAIDELLKESDYPDPNGELMIGDEVKAAQLNAMRALARFLTHTYFRKRHPTVATLFDTIGIFAEESTEVKRALDLVLYPLVRLLQVLTGKSEHTDDIGKSLNSDFFRPLGDEKLDDPLRSTRGWFLILSIIEFVRRSKGMLSGVDKVGSFLFNQGYELAPALDSFPRAAKLANRVLQMQFVPGEVFYNDQRDQETGEFTRPGTGDVVVSFTSIPVFPAGTEEGEPEGFQYVLNANLNLGDFGSDVGDFGIRFPTDFAQSFIWGHKTDFQGIGNNDFPVGTLVRIQQLANRDETQSTEEGRSGDLFFDIEVKKVTVNNQPAADLLLSLTFKDFSLGFTGEGRDGFVQKLLPDSGGMKLKFSATITYSLQRKKLTVEGIDATDGLLFSFRIADKDFKALQVPTLYLGAKPLTDEEKSLSGLEVEASALIKSKLGPFQMTVDRLGLAFSLDFAKKEKANLGFANAGVDLKPPTAVGFLVNASAVTGGGFLSFDPANHQYYGAGELKIKLEKYELTLKVFAIILTQLPDGSKGFSFLILATLEFSPPIDTPLGFKVKGIGVLVAINRSMNLEAFQTAIRDDRIDSVLFPDNPVGNAPAIVKALNAFFPAAQDRYVFAFLARIVWGASDLVDLKVGLLIEVPSPVKLAVAGVLKVSVKKGDKQIVKLQVNFIVALDFGKKIFSMDAAIYASRFLIFDIRGELYVRYRWGNDPVFLIALGGWHPDFEVPAGLNLPAKPQRIAIPLMSGEHTKINLSFYLAVTSNTFQAGFKIELKVKVSKFRLESSLSLDALFHFDPFYFVVDFEGKLGIFWGDSSLAGVKVKGKFSGTNPWRIRGSATFEIWIWDYDVDFDKSTGEEVSEISQTVEVVPLIQKAVTDKANWTAALPNGLATHTILRNTDPDAQQESEATSKPIVADPLSRMEVVQQVTPLGVRIDKLGFQKVNGPKKFDLSVQAEGEPSPSDNKLEDFFAPAMFIQMEDAEKLSRKSFERMNAGQFYADSASVSCGAVRVADINYDDKIRDPLYPRPQPDPATGTRPPIVLSSNLTPDHLHVWARNNSVAKSAAGRRAVALRESVSRAPQMKADNFVLTDATTGARVAEVQGQTSMTAAHYELWKLQTIDPRRKLNVVRESELMQ
ncbi:DUF6603 domain-containing protein [Chryseolinea sp. T2]|uniref:DUF6603 domain-containing protein n=1 Tax=Chryseolinea sp. T2 TaxID=3129255 RepID=UPI003076C017